jgi:hypothetical protein
MVRTELDLGPLRWGGAAMLALGAILPHVAGSPGLPCPLRSATGVPCPFCGLTTSVKATLNGKMHAAAVANPFGMVAVLVAIILVLRPAWRRLQVPAMLLVASVAGSWLFELHRFHFI